MGTPESRGPENGLESLDLYDPAPRWLLIAAWALVAGVVEAGICAALFFVLS